MNDYDFVLQRHGSESEVVEMLGLWAALGWQLPERHLGHLLVSDAKVINLIVSVSMAAAKQAFGQGAETHGGLAREELAALMASADPQIRSLGVRLAGRQT